MVVTVSVSDLKARLSEHLRNVRNGDEVVVTHHGRSIARVVAEDPAASEAELKHLEHSGLIRRGRGGLPDDFWTRRRMKDPEGLLAKAVLDERGVLDNARSVQSARGSHDPTGRHR